VPLPLPTVPGRRPTTSPGSEQVPAGLRAELAERARSSALTVVFVVALAYPAWAVFDRALEPALSERLLVTRMLTEIPVLVCLWLLWRGSVRRRYATPVAFGVLALVQAEVAVMLVHVQHVEFYLLGFSLPLHGSGVLLAARPLWTAALIGTSSVALAVAVLTDPAPMSGQLLVAVAVFVATTSFVALMSHSRRWQLAVREIGARTRLEDEQRRTQELLDRLERLSHEDALTDLANRRRWDAELAAACTHAREQGDRVAVALIDLDRFKQVNDRLGHAAGDAALQAVAALLRQRVRAGDLVARLGGDELAVLLPGADVRAAVGFAERVRAESLALWPEGFDQPGVSLSIGVAVAEGTSTQPRELMAAADAQLYRAKSSRNAVRATGPSLG
jgi:diguanylate cyclase (GGDEF)-like protein